MPARSLNIEIDLSGTNVRDELHRINKEMLESKTGGKDFSHQMDIAGTQMRATAGQAEYFGSKLNMLSTLMKGAAVYFGFNLLKGFNDKIIEESSRTENALIGFKAIVKNTLGAGMENTAVDAAKGLAIKLKGAMGIGAIEDSISNLLSTGFNLQQSTDLVEKNAYIASIRKQHQFKSISEAVVTYTEGMRNNNAMLTDSTGIAENISVTLKRAGLSMEMMNNEATKGAVIQAIYNEHTKQGGVFLDSFKEKMEGFDGQMMKVGVGMKTLQSHLGDVVKIGWTPFVAAFGKVLEYFNAGERGLGRLHTLLVILGAVAIAFLLVYVKTLIVESWALFYSQVAIEGQILTTAGAMKILAAQSLSTAWTFISAWASALLPILAIMAGLAIVYLFLDDLYHWVKGDRSLLGRWLGDADTILPRFKAKIKNMFSNIWIGLKSDWNNMLDDFASLYGKFFSGIWAGISDGFHALVSHIPFINKFVSTQSAAPTLEARASGGPIEPNKPYLVGEKGPELRTFGSGGNIVPNNKLGGKSVSFQININVDALGGESSNARSIGDAAKNAILSAIPAIRAQLGLEVSPA